MRKAGPLPAVSSQPSGFICADEPLANVPNILRMCPPGSTQYGVAVTVLLRFLFRLADKAKLGEFADLALDETAGRLTSEQHHPYPNRASHATEVLNRLRSR